MAFPKEALERLCQENNERVMRTSRPQKDDRTPFQRQVAHMYDSRIPQRQPTLLADTDGSVILGAAGNARDVTPLELRRFLVTGEHLPSDQRWIGPQLPTETIFEAPKPRQTRAFYKARREERETEERNKRALKKDRGGFRPQQGGRR